MKSGEDLLAQKISVVPPPTAEQVAKAKIVACANAVNADEARDFLGMLGLL